MLLTTLGATGMGSMLKIIGSIFASLSEAREAKAKRELIRDLSFRKQILNFKKQFLVKWIKTRLFLPGVLAGSLLLSGCVTFSSSQSSVPYIQTQPLSPSPLQKTKNRSIYSGDSSNSQVGQILQQVLPQDTSLWSQSPLWGRSSASTSLLGAERVK